MLRFFTALFLLALASSAAFGTPLRRGTAPVRQPNMSWTDKKFLTADGRVVLWPADSRPRAKSAAAARWQHYYRKSRTAK
jgi:hypothetical protein